MSTDLSDFSMFELFRQEAESQTTMLTQGLLALERDPSAAAQLEALMRSAHSLKGAGRIIGLDAAVRLAHAMEDCFVAAQKGKVVLGPEAMDLLLRGVDLFSNIAQTPEKEMEIWSGSRSAELEDMLVRIRAIATGQPMPAQAQAAAAPAPPTPPPAPPEPSVRANSPLETTAAPLAPPTDLRVQDRVLRVTAENLNRLLGLAGESLVESRWLNPYADSLLRLKRQQGKLAKILEDLRENMAGRNLEERAQARLNEAQQQAIFCTQTLADRHAELELYSRRSVNLAHRLYREAVASRMRPLADGVHAFPRLIRDLARSLGKEVKLEIVGEATQVDRDVLEQLEAPLSHLLRNAVDHGIEPPAERQTSGKPPTGSLRLEARHSAGLLMVVVQDDGRGIDPDQLRRAIVQKGLTTTEIAANLSDEELFAFLFLPGFSLREKVTEVSGRGVGLDVVQTMVKSLRGQVRVTSSPGQGARFQLQLPLTLSVLRALLANVSGEPYAFPLGRVEAVMEVPRAQIEMIEGREHIPCKGRRIGLVAAHQILEKGAAPSGDHLAVLVVGEHHKTFGVVVDKFLGERELVVQPLDPRLGKVRNISAAALMPDGAPVLIVDVEDMTRSIELLISGGRLSNVQQAASVGQRRRKRVLVVDDSLTVRELERKLLGARGYQVEVAVDGMDGWNAVRTEAYDLVVSDVDMPRLDGIELVTLIKKDPRLKTLPVMIVSYKDREEDRRRGLDAGADYYLTKGSFHDETLLNAVADLIGDAEEETDT